MKNALCLGTFDGVHKGHCSVIESAKGYNRIAVTFKKPPKMIFSRKDELICTYRQKCEILKKIGINEIVALDFDEVRSDSPKEFIDFLYNKFNPSVIACGFNYNFGKNGQGDISFLAEYCNKKGIELKCSEPIKFGVETVSSTLIRGYIRDGRLQEANSLLTEPFSFEAVVNHGEKRGRTIGFPTINQEYPKELVKPRFGVYKVKICFDGKEYIGISDIGVRPTYPLDYVISETFIKDFRGDLYGKNVKIIPLEFLRGEKKFQNLTELKNQIAEDINKI